MISGAFVCLEEVMEEAGGAVDVECLVDEVAEDERQ